MVKVYVFTKGGNEFVGDMAERQAIQLIRTWRDWDGKEPSRIIMDREDSYGKTNSYISIKSIAAISYTVEHT